MSPLRAVVPLLALGLSLLALAGAARADWVNPCAFGGFDQPCKVEGGTYRALKPEGRGPFPTVVYLHGSGGRASDVASNRYLQRTIVDRGYVLIAPTALDAVNYREGRNTGWSLRSRPGHPRDDVAFLRRVLDHAQERFRIDRRRVLFVGQSDGGFLIWEIACHTPGLASAYATHAGSYGGPLPERCKGPMRFLQVHGRRDTVVPFEAERHLEMRVGDTGKVLRRLTSADVREGLAILAQANGCRRAGEMAPRAFNGFDRQSWIGCASAATLDYLVHEGGHDYPARFMPAVLDWFEALPLAPPGVGTTNFHAPGSDSGVGKRFKAVPRRAGSK